MNSLPGDLRKSYLGIAFTVLWPSLWSFPGICAMIVFTAGSLKVFFSLKVPFHYLITKVSLQIEVIRTL